jgi:hypothetical protein
LEFSTQIKKIKKMKKNIISLLLIILISCNHKQDKLNVSQHFIDVDNNKDFKFYFNNLSNDYIDILKKQFKSNDTSVVFDSIVKSKNELINSFKLQKFNFTNTITDSIRTSNRNLLIIKYNTNFAKEGNLSQSYVERVVLQVSNNKIKKFIPYNPELNPEIDSLLKSKYAPIIYSELQKSLLPTHYKNNDIEFSKIKNQIELYSESFKKNDTSFLRYIYPPLIKSYLNSNNKSKLSTEDKREILNIFKEQLASRNLNFENFIIKDFNRINCSLKQKIYIVKYVLQMNGTLFLKGRMIIVFENNNIYFLEANIEDLKQIGPPYFSIDFINCIEKSIND